MRHHFGDFLDRDGGYWTVIPNRQRYAYRIGDIRAGSPEITIVTIGKDDAHWARVLTLPNLEELTLHSPTAEQLLAVETLRGLKRLRITHARPKTIDFIASITGLEEVVLEYVSGVTDLGPLGTLKSLRALHLENLRRVSDFSGLAGATGLRYLAIYGTGDWQQPVDGFEFLRGLPQLEVFRLWEVKCRAAYPAMLPAASLHRLKKLGLHRGYFATEEYALLEEALKGVEGATWGPYEKVAESHIELSSDDVRTHLPEDVLRENHPDVWVRSDGKRFVDDPASQWFVFTGRAAGRVKCSTPAAEARCRERSERYEALKAKARDLIGRARDAYPG